MEVAFAGQPDVLMISVHEEARWPHTGAVQDDAGGNGFNLPVPRGYNDTEAAEVCARLLVPRLAAHGAEALVLQCGADALTEEMLAKARFTAAGTLPSIGELAEVTVALPARSRTLAIPNAAVHRVKGQTGVWVIRNGELVFAPVRIGAQDLSGWVQILDGLTRGERLVVHSARALTSSSRFRIVETLP